MATPARRLGLPIGEQKRSWPTSRRPARLRSHGAANPKVFGGGLGEPVLLKKGSPKENKRTRRAGVPRRAKGRMEEREERCLAPLRSVTPADARRYEPGWQTGWEMCLRLPTHPRAAAVIADCGVGSAGAPRDCRLAISDCRLDSRLDRSLALPSVLIRVHLWFPRSWFRVHGSRHLAYDQHSSAFVSIRGFVFSCLLLLSASIRVHLRFHPLPSLLLSLCFLRALCASVASPICAQSGVSGGLAVR